MDVWSSYRMLSRNHGRRLLLIRFCCNPPPKLRRGPHSPVEYIQAFRSTLPPQNEAVVVFSIPVNFSSCVNKYEPRSLAVKYPTSQAGTLDNSSLPILLQQHQKIFWSRLFHASVKKRSCVNPAYIKFVYLLYIANP